MKHKEEVSDLRNLPPCLLTARLKEVGMVDSMRASVILQKFPHFRISATRTHFGQPITPLSYPNLVQLASRRNFCWSMRVRLNEPPRQRFPFRAIALYGDPLICSGDLAMMKGSAKEERGGVFNLKKGPSAHLSQSSLYSDEVHHSPYLRLVLRTLSPLDRDTEEIGRTGVLKTA